jgi:hypothetical protein
MGMHCILIFQDKELVVKSDGVTPDKVIVRVHSCHSICAQTVTAVPLPGTGQMVKPAPFASYKIDPHVFFDFIEQWNFD